MQTLKEIRNFSDAGFDERGLEEILSDIDILKEAGMWQVVFSNACEYPDKSVRDLVDRYTDFDFDSEILESDARELNFIIWICVHTQSGMDLK